MVVAILALVVALLLPALGMARSMARSAACQAHLRQLYIATDAYADDHDGIYPPVNLPKPDATDPTDYWIWSWLIMPYALEGQTVAYGQLPKRRSVLRGCPAWVKGKYQDNIGYGINEKLGLPGNTMTSNWVAHASIGRATWWKTDAVEYPSLRVLFGDSQRYTCGIADHYGLAPEKLADPERHHGRANYVMCDGHVESLARLQAGWGQKNPLLRQQ